MSDCQPAPLPKSESIEMDRRAIVAAVAAGISGLTAAATLVHAADEHAGHAEHQAGHDHAAGAVHQALIDLALKCVNRGEVCTDHCLAMLSKGDTSLKDCIRTVAAMMPLCEGLAKLAAQNSPRLPALAKLCADVCEDCEKECKKHAEHHAVCKACADSCRECIDACKKVI